MTAVHDRVGGQDTRLRRAVDVLVGCVGLLGLLPLLTVIAVLVRMSSPGPAVFRQVRVGRDGRPFEIWKFRSMVVDAENRGGAVSGPADGRVTPVGRLLRRTRLDELPQLVNLIRGDMTLIGPRPEVPRFVVHYTPAERSLLAVRPGVIGPGAVLFASKQADELDAAEDADAFYVRYHLHPKLELDLAYLHERGLRRDLQMVRVALAVLLPSRLRAAG